MTDQPSRREIEVIPALLPKSFDELREALARLRGLAPLVQIDLVGRNILVGQEEMPRWEEFDFEFDLMLPNPAREIEICIAMGASRIVIHADASSAQGALETLQSARTGNFAVGVGLALRAHDTPETLKGFEGLYDYVQVMGIDHVGAQGEPPDPHHHELKLIRALRALYPELLLQVDGAVAPHVRELVRAGASRLVVGSAIVLSENPREALRALYTEANAS